MKSISKNGHPVQKPCTFEEISVRSSIPSEDGTFLFIDNWQEKQYPFTRDQWGVWRGTIPPLADGSPAIKHGQAIKVK